MAGITVSVVVIGYNGRAFIDRCLGSLLDQDYPPEDYEVILLDNGSSDGMGEFARENYPAVRVVRLERNLGFNEACNQSLAFAEGDYLVFLPQDTVVHRRWLSSLVYLARSAFHIKVCWTNTINPWAPEFGDMDRMGPPGHVYFPEITPLGFTRVGVLPYTPDPRYSLGIAGTSFLIKRDVVDELGGAILDGSFSHYCGDTDLGLRTNLLGYGVAMSPDAVVFHLDTGKSVLSSALLKRYFWGTVDRVLLFFKCMGLFEFLLFVPLLVVGLAGKVLSMHLRPLKQWAVFCVMFPLAPLVFVVSMCFISKVSEGRRRIRRHPGRGDLWLLRELLSRGRLKTLGGK